MREALFDERAVVIEQDGEASIVDRLFDLLLCIPCGRTFADKIKIFKKSCDFGGVPDNAFTRSWMTYVRCAIFRSMVRHGKVPSRVNRVSPIGLDS
jgi:hypothetical protein